MRRELGSGRVQTELGPLLVAATEAGVCFVALCADGAEEAFERWCLSTLPRASRVTRAAHVDAACRELDAFARGARRTFEVPLDPFGSPFQRAVWAELRRIPYGATRTYGQVARALGQPGASRAVGMANHRNPIPILVPCHRVVAAHGLGGFGAGLDWKRRLLALEGALLPLQND